LHGALQWKQREVRREGRWKPRKKRRKKRRKAGYSFAPRISRCSAEYRIVKYGMN
jgi:hypothetical protein